MTTAQHTAFSLALAAIVGVSPGIGCAKGIIGWLEHVTIETAGITLEAKIDSGADNSSVHATNISRYEKNGQKWVSYQLTSPEGRSVILDSPVIRTTRIKLKTGGYIKRPVVALSLCLDTKRIQANVNLADRGHFEYPLLIGRSTLSQLFLIDVSGTYLTKPQCNTQ